MPRFGRVVTVLALLGLLGAGRYNVGAQPLRPQTEVFAVNPGKVIEVTYRSAEIMLIAHRWQVQDKFTFIFLKKRHKPLICPAGPGFDVVLSQVTSLKLRRALSAKEAKELFQKYPASSWAELRVRDNSALKPFRALIMPVAGQPNAAFVHFDGSTYIVSFAARVFHLISGGCKLLAAPSPP
jgi:hypothetical protein